MVVWYVSKDGKFVGIISRELPDSWNMRDEAKKYSDSRVWVKANAGWWYMPTETISNAIWAEGNPPDSVKMAQMLREWHGNVHVSLHQRW